MNHLILKTGMLLPLSLALGLFILPSFAQATGIVGGSLIVQNTGNVHITFSGSDAGYTSTLYLGDTALFSNRDAAGTTINLGNFAAGTELNFRLEVHNTGMAYFTGIGANNVDGVAHAMVTNMGSGLTQVGFEDLYGGGDQDYNDLVFQFSNTTAEDNTVQGKFTGEGEGTGEEKLIANPEPSTIILFGSGIIGLGAWRLRKKQV